MLRGEDTKFLEKLSDKISIINGDITNEKDCISFTENSKNANTSTA